jgi:hypothetical protein
MTKAEREKLRAQEREALAGFELLTDELVERIKLGAEDFEGRFEVLESAVGALVIGRMYGWRVLRLVHDSRTSARYERVLGLKFKDVCPERGILARRSIGLAWADKLGEFWRIARGDIQVEQRRDVGIDFPLTDGVA